MNAVLHPGRPSTTKIDEREARDLCVYGLGVREYNLTLGK